MKTAIDFYERGKLKEANADEYNRSSYYSKNRFICPECGEPVHLTGSKYANFFSHYKKTDISAECERRVDAIPSSSLYQRMGLPLYLRYEGKEYFRLYIGFRKMSVSLMRIARECNALVVLDGKTKYRVSDERFSSKETTLIGIDYIPMYGRNYSITYLPEKMESLLSENWSDYADGFSFDGAIFTVTEQGGKKIRHGDTISCDTEYYWVRRQPTLPAFVPGINMQKVGVLGLKDNKWYVYKGYFTSSIIDSQYETLCQYLRNNLKVYLLEKKPEFVPMWPPVIMYEDGYVVDENVKTVYGYISSGNEEPKVYEFKGNRALYNELFIDDKVTRVYMDTSETVINIDRKYISNGVLLTKERILYVSQNADIIVKNGGESQVIEGIKEIKSSGIQISGNNVFDVIVIHENGEVKNNTGLIEIQVDNLSQNDTILIIQSKRLLGILYNESIETVENNRSDFESIWKCIVLNQNKEFIKIPFEIRKRLVSLLNGNEKLDREIQRLLKANLISKPVISLLELEGNYGRN